MVFYFLILEKSVWSSYQITTKNNYQCPLAYRYRIIKLIIAFSRYQQMTKYNARVTYSLTELKLLVTTKMSSELEPSISKLIKNFPSHKSTSDET